MSRKGAKTLCANLQVKTWTPLPSASLALATRAKLRHFSARAKKSSRRLARVNALAEKLRFLPHLSEHERVLYAWSLAATPDERWQRHESFLRSHGLFTRSGRKKYGLSS